MRVMRDFRCTACEKVTERYIDSEITGILCDCGSLASREISVAAFTKPDIMSDTWAKTRIANAKRNARQNS